MELIRAENLKRIAAYLLSVGINDKCVQNNKVSDKLVQIVESTDDGYLIFFVYCW